MVYEEVHIAADKLVNNLHLVQYDLAPIVIVCLGIVVCDAIG